MRESPACTKSWRKTRNWPGLRKSRTASMGWSWLNVSGLLPFFGRCRCLSRGKVVVEEGGGGGGFDVCGGCCWRRLLGLLSDDSALRFWGLDVALTLVSCCSCCCCRASAWAMREAPNKLWDEGQTRIEVPSSTAIKKARGTCRGRQECTNTGSPSVCGSWGWASSRLKSIDKSPSSSCPLSSSSWLPSMLLVAALTTALMVLMSALACSLSGDFSNASNASSFTPFLISANVRMKLHGGKISKIQASTKPIPLISFSSQGRWWNCYIWTYKSSCMRFLSPGSRLTASVPCCWKIVLSPACCCPVLLTLGATLRRRSRQRPTWWRNIEKSRRGATNPRQWLVCQVRIPSAGGVDRIMKIWISVHCVHIYGIK